MRAGVHNGSGTVRRWIAVSVVDAAMVAGLPAFLRPRLNPPSCRLPRCSTAPGAEATSSRLIATRELLRVRRSSGDEA